MTSKVDKLKLDIEDVNAVLQHATRQRTKDLLTLELRKLETELAKLGGYKTSYEATNSSSSSVSNKCYEVKLNNYGWDQTNANTKLYVSLNNVHQLPAEAVTCNFEEKSMHLRVLGLDNKNYNLLINNLCEEIVPEKSNVKVKTDLLVVTLVKKVPKMWSEVTGVEKMIKESKSAPLPDPGADPTSNVIDIVKRLYQEGDENTKRAISQAWVESQMRKEGNTTDLE